MGVGRAPKGLGGTALDRLTADPNPTTLQIVRRKSGEFIDRSQGRSVPSRKNSRQPPPTSPSSEAAPSAKRPRGRPPLLEVAKSATERGQEYRERKRAEGVAELLLRVQQPVIRMLDALCALSGQTRSEVVTDLIIEARGKSPRKRKTT